MSGNDHTPEALRLLSAASRRRNHSDDPTLEANKRIVARLFLEIVNERRYEVADEVFAADFHWPQFGTSGPDAFKSWVRGFHEGLPDVQDTIELQVAEGDMVVTMVTVVGTHRGPWLGLSPTGRFCRFLAIGIDRLRDGKIVERSATFDLAGVLRQLGIDRLP